MNSKPEFSEADIGLITDTINDFLDGSRALQVPDMTHMMGGLIESCVLTLARNTDPDTALQVLSLILLRLGPKCQAGRVEILHAGVLSEKTH